MGEAMVFHYPLGATTDRVSGSTVRPRMMKSAFEAIGYNVIEVTGQAVRRSEVMKRILEELYKGKTRIAFAYVETPNIPITLSESRHWPPHPMLDFRFLRVLKRFGVPVGVFIRDFYWRFPYYRKAVPLLKRLVTVPLFHYESWQFSRIADVVFLPSAESAAVLPVCMRGIKKVELPPGAEIHRVRPRSLSTKQLTLLYVGSVLPPEHDVLPVFVAASRLMAAFPLVTFVICCPQSEWQYAKGLYAARRYDPEQLPNVKVIHASGQELKEIYAAADIALMVTVPDEYHRIAMPIKVFEAFGFGLPVIANRPTPYGRLIEKTGMGWAIESPVEGLVSVVEKCMGDPSVLQSARQAVLQQRQLHSWEARANRVAAILTATESRETLPKTGGSCFDGTPSN